MLLLLSTFSTKFFKEQVVKYLFVIRTVC